jgi:hypothetical protein
MQNDQMAPEKRETFGWFSAPGAALASALAPAGELWYNSRKAAIIPASPIDRIYHDGALRLWYNNLTA